MGTSEQTPEIRQELLDWVSQHRFNPKVAGTMGLLQAYLEHPPGSPVLDSSHSNSVFTGKEALVRMDPLSSKRITLLSESRKTASTLVCQQAPNIHKKVQSGNTEVIVNEAKDKVFPVPKIVKGEGLYSVSLSKPLSEQLTLFEQVKENVYEGLIAAGAMESVKPHSSPH